jgi:DNA polymerase V
MNIDLVDVTDLPVTQSVTLHSDPVCAGFPSPARDTLEKPLDFNELIIAHPASTFAVRADGFSMVKTGIGPGDILVADRSVTARHGHIVIAAIDGEFVVKRFETNPRTRLVAMSDDYPDIELTEGQELEIWGVVTFCVKSFL